MADEVPGPAETDEAPKGASNRAWRSGLLVDGDFLASYFICDLMSIQRALKGEGAFGSFTNEAARGEQ